MKSIKDIPGVQPWFFGRDEEILRDIAMVLKDGTLTQGKFLEKFEASFARVAGTRFCAGINSGGMALELIWKAIGVRGKKVIVPTDTFVATPASVIQAGGDVIFSDIEEDTLCLDPRDVLRRITSDTVAIATVHMFGIMSDGIAQLQKICHERGIVLVEDAAHAHGASYKGVPAGALGTAAAFSFYATKVLTTGEGGLVTTNDEKLYKAILRLRNHGRILGHEEFDEVSNNYRLSEIPAILGCHQVDFLQQNISHRNRLADLYFLSLQKTKEVRLLKPSKDGRHSYWRFPIYLDEAVDRLRFQKVMAQKYKVRLTWMYEPLCHLQPVYRRMYGTKLRDFPVAERCIARLVCLPCHLGVSPEDVHYICEAISKSIEEVSS
jgi:dTDP-4-amino-4,6-dideoxygalactose transaminase